MFPDYSFQNFNEPHEALEPYCKSLSISYLLIQADPHPFLPIDILKKGSSLPLLMFVVDFRYQLLTWLWFYIIFSYRCQQIHRSSDGVSNVCGDDCSSSEEMPAHIWGDYVHCKKKTVIKNIRLGNNQTYWKGHPLAYTKFSWIWPEMSFMN